jgi:hypothetical protein
MKAVVDDAVTTHSRGAQLIVEGCNGAPVSVGG